MGTIKKPNAIRAIRYTGWVAGLLFGFLDLYIAFTDLFAPLSMLNVPEALVGRVEVVGGIWILLVTWAALLAGRHPRALNYFGVAVGVAGVLTLFRLSRCWRLVLGWVRSRGTYGWGSSGSAVAEARRRENCARSSQVGSECE